MQSGGESQTGYESQMLSCTAEFDEDKSDRYSLTREWSDDKSKKLVCFVLLNPSKAGASQWDPTVMKCFNYVSSRRDWQERYRGIIMVNLYLGIDPKSGNLKKRPLTQNRRNLQAIRNALGQSGGVIIGWGSAANKRDVQTFMKVFDEVSNGRLYLLCLNEHHVDQKETSDSPVHPAKPGFVFPNVLMRWNLR